MASREFLESAQLSGHCVVSCDGCDREYFAADGQYDWYDGELEDLIKKSEEDPDKYIASEYDSIKTIHINGQQLVVDCKCGTIEKIEKGVWSNRDWIMKYIQSMLMSKRHQIDEEISNSYICMDEIAQCHIHNIESQNRILRMSNNRYIEVESLVSQRLDSYTKNLESENEALRKKVPESKFDMQY